MATNPTELVEKYIAAYNEQDFEAVASCFAPDLHFEHFNKGYRFNSRDELITTLKAFASSYMPDRTMGPALRTKAIDNTVFREHVWSGTLAADVPGFGAKGDKVAHRLCAVFTVGAAGLITEYFDYG